MKRRILVLLLAMISAFGAVESTAQNSQLILSLQARISVLTCTPGPDLYSVFGHTAIRVEDVQKGQMLDEVYNYGTFEFSESFYLNFVQGKLDYKLSRTDFGTFQQEYIYTGRGIQEQVLRLDSADKQLLYDLLLENYNPENRVYRYDYFYDNCSSRVGEIIQRAAGGDMKLTYVSAVPYSYRDAIDNYLWSMPWSDFGIDLALGMPCDRILDSGDDFFLPDSLLKELHYATYGSGGLCFKPQEVIPAEFAPSSSDIGTPLQVFLAVLLIQVLFFRLRRGKPGISFFDRILLIVTGIVGWLLFFLWFFTDHQAAAWNFNLLWANPFNLFFAMLSVKAMHKWAYMYFQVNLIVVSLLLVFWVFLPQNLHEAALPLVIALGWIAWRGAKLKKTSSPQVSA